MSRRRGAALAASALAALALAGPAATAVAAPRTAEATATPVRVAITTLEPLTPTPAGTLVVGGTITDTAAAPVTSLQVGLFLGQPVPDRSTLHAETRQPPSDVAQVFGAAVRAPGQVDPGATVAFSIRIPLARVEGLDPHRLAVYPLQVHVDGLLDGTAEQVGTADTFLPWFPGRPASPVRLVWLWPLDARPSLDAQGALVSRHLVRELSGGRLDRLLRASVPVPGGPAEAPVTYLVAPSLLQAVRQLTTPWHLAGSAGTQPPVPAAAAFLSTLTARLDAGAGLVSLPYGDPDVVALQRAGLANDVVTAFPLGARVTGQVLGRTPVTSVYRPPGGVVDQATLDTLASAGVDTVVLNDTQVPTAAGSTVPTATAVTTLPTLGSPVRVLASDDYLDSLLAAGGRGAGSLRMAEQLVLAETALIVTEAPNSTQQRDVVLAPPRRWDPRPGFVAALLAATRKAGWLDPVPLAATAADPAGDRSGLGPYPASARAAELPGSRLAPTGGADSLAALRAELADAASMLSNQSLLEPLTEALYRAESATWRTDLAGQARMAGGARAALDGLLAAVRVASAPQVTLTSRTGTIPVTIANDLPQPVTVLLTVDSPDPSKLRTPQPTMQTVGAHEKQRVLLPAQTQRAGTFTVSLQLSTPDGRPLGAPVPVLVHSSAYGNVAIAITGGALGVLALALARQLLRRLRRRRLPPSPPVPG